MNILNRQLAMPAARALGHQPREWRNFGVMWSSTCAKCGLGMVERESDHEGVTGAMLERECKK